VSLTLTAQPPRTVHVVEAELAEIRYSYDPSKLLPYRFTDLVGISPVGGQNLMPPQLELCIDNDADYLPCGDRTLSSPNFLRNADVNLRKGRDILSRLERLNVPPSLTPALQFYRRGASFWLCLERARLAYYRGERDALRTQCDTVDASARCPDSLVRARAAQTPAARADVATYSWHNCMNSAFHEVLGMYPLESWAAFLKEFDIEEVVVTVG
jgi:hypothetical protein